MILLPAAFPSVAAPGFSAVTAADVAVPPTPPPDPGGQGEDFGKAAPVALVVLLLFFVAVALLVRSMNKHLRRIPKSFESDSGTPPREE
jgi:hypothetical protein